MTQKRQPVRITITIDGGEVYRVLTEGKEFGSDLTKPFAKASFLDDIDLYTRAAISEANRRAEPVR